MSQFSVKLYKPEYKKLWDDFVSKSYVDSFLFFRDFMEYHQDRFHDFSLLIFKEDNLVALLPANQVESSIYSHQGLTFGGLQIQDKVLEGEIKELFKAIKIFFKSHDILELIIKDCLLYTSPSPRD